MKSEKRQNRFSFHKKGVILPLDWGCSRHTCCLNKKTEHPKCNEMR